MSGAQASRRPAAVGLVDEAGGVGGVRRERLLGVDVLAGRERLADHGRVHGGRRQVEDDVDRRVGDRAPSTETAGRPCSAASARACAVVEVGAGDELERVERLRVLGVLAADHAAAEHAHARRRLTLRPPASPRSAASERRAASSDGPVRLVLLDEQPLDPGLDRRRRDALVADGAVADRSERAPLAARRSP